MFNTDHDHDYTPYLPPSMDTGFVSQPSESPLSTSTDGYFLSTPRPVDPALVPRKSALRIPSLPMPRAWSRRWQQRLPVFRYGVMAAGMVAMVMVVTLVFVVATGNVFSRGDSPFCQTCPADTSMPRVMNLLPYDVASVETIKTGDGWHDRNVMDTDGDLVSAMQRIEDELYDVFQRDAVRTAGVKSWVGEEMDIVRRGTDEFLFIHLDDVSAARNFIEQVGGATLSSEPSPYVTYEVNTSNIILYQDWLIVGNGQQVQALMTQERDFTLQTQLNSFMDESEQQRLASGTMFYVGPAWFDWISDLPAWLGDPIDNMLPEQVLGGVDWNEQTRQLWMSFAAEIGDAEVSPSIAPINRAAMADMLPNNVIMLASLGYQGNESTGVTAVMLNSDNDYGAFNAVFRIFFPFDFPLRKDFGIILPHAWVDGVLSPEMRGILNSLRDVTGFGFLDRPNWIMVGTPGMADAILRAETQPETRLTESAAWQEVTQQLPEGTALLYMDTELVTAPLLDVIDDFEATNGALPIDVRSLIGVVPHYAALSVSVDRGIISGWSLARFDLSE